MNWIKLAGSNSRELVHLESTLVLQIMFANDVEIRFM
jgi:hypothetical protein